MNNESKVLLNLLHDYIKQIPSDEIISDGFDWQLMTKTAIVNNVLPFMYHQIKKFNIDSNYILYLKNIVIRSSSNQIITEQYLINVIEELNKANIRFMILKGVILAKLYPHPEYRYTADADIHIAPNDLSSVQKIMTDMGYEHKYSNTVKYDYSYILDGVHIEIHTRLFEDFYDKHSKILEEYKLDSFARTMNYNVLEKEILSLCPNEFLIYNICHMTKHFVDSGINLRHLTDITILINSYIGELDIEYIMTFFKKIKLNEFVKYTLRFCNKYLGMYDIPEIDYSDINEEVSDEFITDFLEYTNENFTDINKTAAFVAYYKNDKGVIKSRLFPKRDSLSEKYKYAKKHGWLLPIAWIHRYIDHIGRIFKTSIHMKSLKSSRRRVDLFMKMGLLK